MSFKQEVERLAQLVAADFDAMTDEQYVRWREVLEFQSMQAIEAYDRKEDVDTESIDRLLDLNDEFPLLYGEDAVRLYAQLLAEKPEEASVYERYVDYLAAIADATHPEFLAYAKLVEEGRFADARKRSLQMPKRLGLE